MIKVRYSHIDQYLTCPRMYYLGQVLKLVPVKESPKLTFGTGIHKGIETYYATGSEEAALKAYNDWLDGVIQKAIEGGYKEKLVQSKEFKNIDLGESLLKEYITFAKAHDNFIPTHVEQEFEVPVLDENGEQLVVEGEEVYHKGTFDLVAVDQWGNTWLGEHKTASSFPNDFSLQLNIQNSLYVLAGMFLFDNPPKGVIYNVIRKVAPSRSRGAVIMRRHIGRSVRELSYAQQFLARTVKAMLTDEYYDFRPGFHCEWKCPYQHLCSCMLDGIPVEEAAEGMFVRREEDDAYTDTAEAA